METRKKEESGKWTEERKKCHSCGTCPRESGEQESRKLKMKTGAIKQIAIKRLSEIKNVHFSLLTFHYSLFAICCSLN